MVQRVREGHFTRRFKVRSLLCCLATGMAVNLCGAMVDPVIDDPNQPWCYLAKSTTVIGVPFVPEPIQVTYDGAVYTRNAELCFFYGEQNEPVLARHKTFHEGWLPQVEYEWKDRGIAYRVEIFATTVSPLGVDNVVVFARMVMKNEAPNAQVGVFTSAIRGSGETDRLGATRWGMMPSSRLDFTEHGFIRDGKLVYTFSRGGEAFSVPGQPYDGPFTGARFGLTNRHETGLVRYRITLEPGQAFSADFKMPRQCLSNREAIEAVSLADHDSFQARTKAYWKDLIEGGTQFVIPERRVNDSYKAALVHLLLATRASRGQDGRQGSGLPYDALFLNDYMDMMLAYDLGGLSQFSEPNVDWLLRKQHASGMFIDVHNRGNDHIVTSHGQGLFCLAYHYLITRDPEYARKVYPAVRKGVQLIIQDHETNPHGLIRPSIPYDAPMLTGHHTCHNLFALTALQASIRMARLIGEDQDAAAWLKVQKSYKQAILKAMDHTIAREGYIASGLYDWSAGWVQGREGFVNDHPNQDWENNLLLFPSEIMAPDDPRVTHTLATIRQRKYREGVMTYRNGMHVHQYVTLNQANQYLAQGDQRHALSDLYHVLLHNGSTHEGFENLVVPWSRLVRPSCPPPHAWAAAKTALFIRNCMVREFGGQAGMTSDERGLYLFSLISPAWATPGQTLTIRNAVTEMGTVSAAMVFHEQGADINIESQFHTPPAFLALTVPYFVELVRVDAGAGPLDIRDGIIKLQPSTKKISMVWRAKEAVHERTFQSLLRMYRREYGYVKDRNRYLTETPPRPALTPEETHHPAAPMSFALVREAFAHEYRCRVEISRETGVKPIRIEAPKIREAHPVPVSPVTASAFIAGHEPAKAFDGICTDLASSWQADPYPAWLKIDLGTTQEINGLRIVPYWGLDRYYQYTVEVSEHGETWHPVCDMSKNILPSTPAGDTFEFAPIRARFVRVNMLYHNLNRGVHIVEVVPSYP